MDQIIEKMLQFICSTRLKTSNICVDEAMQLRDNLVTEFQKNQSKLTDNQCADLLYCLLAALDETMMTHANEPTLWSKHNALNKYYNDNLGGDNFYQRIEKYCHAETDSDKYICKINFLILALGFKGKAILNESVWQSIYCRLASLFKTHCADKTNDKEHEQLAMNNQSKTILLIAIVLACSSYSYLNHRYIHLINKIQYSTKKLKMSTIND